MISFNKLFSQVSNTVFNQRCLPEGLKPKPKVVVGVEVRQRRGGSSFISPEVAFLGGPKQAEKCHNTSDTTVSGVSQNYGC